MNPIDLKYPVVIQKIEQGQEIPESKFKILDHKIHGVALDILIWVDTNDDPEIRALWDEKNGKLLLVGGKVDGTQITETPDGTIYDWSPHQKMWISVDFSPLGKIGTWPIFRRVPPQPTADPLPGENQDELLMTVNKRYRKIYLVYPSIVQKNKKKDPIYPIAIKKIEPGQTIPITTFIVYDHNIRGSILKVKIENDGKGKPAVQALWDETNEKLYLVNGKKNKSPDAEISETPDAVSLAFGELEVRKKAWISIDLSTLGKTGKLNIFKMAPAIFAGRPFTWLVKEHEELLMSVNLSKSTRALGKKTSD